MGRTYWKTVWREITGSFGRFMSIFAIVALGTGFLAGLMATSPDMRLSVDAYYDEAAVMDLRVISTLGLTDEDVADLQAVEGVSAVMPGFSVDVLAAAGERVDVTAKFYNLPPADATPLNRVTVLEGRMPEKSTECVAVRQKSVPPPAVGTVITADHESMGQSTFTVVGVVDSAYYFSIDRETGSVGDGTVEWILFAPQNAFTAEVYSTVYLQVTDAAALNAFEEEYKDKVELVSLRLEAMGDTVGQRRYDTVVGEATAELNKAKAEYDEKKAEAEAELAKAEKELADAREKIAEGETALADGKAQLAENRVELQKAEERYDEGLLALRDARQVLAARRTAVYSQLAEQEEELAANNAELTAALEQLAAGKPALEQAAAEIAAMEKQLAGLLAFGQVEQAAALQAALDVAKPAYEEQLALFTAGETELLGAKTRLEEGAVAIEEARRTAEEEFAAIEAQLTDTETALADAAAEIAAGKQALAAGEQELKEKEAELQKGKEDLAAGEAEYATAKADAEEQLAEGQAKLDEAAADIAAIPFPTWYVLDRQSIAAFSGFDGNCQKVEAIATVFPIFFFLVAALVALTTMTRMVEEQRGAIGVLRALGYGKVAVAGKFLLYAGLATVSGGAVGLAVGMKVFPAVIYYVYGIMYIQPPLLSPFRWDYALVIGTLALLCTGLATLFACMGTLRERPARLMMPKAPKAGKRVFLEYLPLWKRMSFLQKVTARNLFRYKKRFFMTVLGVMGCTALLLAGFGLHDSIFGIGDKQYGELSSYDMMAVMKTEEALQDESILALREDERLTASLGVYQQSVDVKKEKERLSVHLFVPEDAAPLPDFITLRQRESGGAVPLTDEGAVLTEKAAATLGVSAGDTVEIIRTDGTAATVTVGGVAENYVNSYLYLTPAAYEKAFGEVPPCQILLLKERKADSGIAADLLATDQVSALTVTADMRASISDMLGSLDAIVVVIILCAGLLAFVVLYNLTNINITERQRELATLKVLGFYDSESAAYIYRENAVLTLIGIAVGLVAGIFLHQFVIRTAEVEMVMFQRTVQPLSYLWAALLTLVFAALVDVVMLRRLRRIDMVESMKSGE